MISNDVHCNPGPLESPTVKICIGCNQESPLLINTESITNLEWICDTCVELVAQNFEFDRSADQLLESLPNGVKYAHINLCGLMNKLDQLRILLRKQTFDVLAISQSKLDSSIEDSEIRIRGYRTFRKDRNRHGGGVIMYIKEKWSATNVVSVENLEMLTLDMKQLNSPKVKVGVVYRPPDANVRWYEDFELAVDIMTAEMENTILMGDFNVNQFTDNRMKNIMDTHGFNQLITEPTRETINSRTLITFT